ncbi:MAG: SDR family NAD(P)-dependent oxidoreductase [Acidimicrobiales bacterium]
MGELDGQVAIVTGSTRGIGRGIAERFVAEGAQVVVNGTSRDPVLAIAAELDAHPEPCDLGDPAQAAAMVANTAERFGRLDIVVNNAGLALDNYITGATDERWQRVLDVNLTGAFVVLREATRTMKAQRNGSVVNVVSWAGTNGNIGQVAYSASKAGLIGVTKTAAKELAPFGVRVNALSPQVPTDMTGQLSDEQLEDARLAIPMQRFGAMSEVVEGALWLASSRSSFTTGTILPIDGGLHLN